MNKFLSLTRIQLKDFLSRYQSGLNVRGNLIGKFLLVLVAGLLLLPSIQFSLMLYEPFMMIGYPELIITNMYISAVMIMLFSALPFIISIFFYSKDLKFLASLPIGEDTILFSKLSAVYVYLLGIGGFILGPTLVVYGMKTGLHWYYILSAVIALIMTPILPMLISALIILPMMRVVSSSSKRNIISILGGFLFVIVIIGIQITVARLQIDTEMMERLILQEDGLLRMIGLRFPPSIWLTNMVDGSILSGLMFILFNAAFIVALKYLSKMIYSRAMLAFNQEGGVMIKTGRIYYEKRSKAYQLIRRHVFIITSNPTFFMNTFLTLLIPVIVFGIMFFTGEATLKLFASPEIRPYMLYIFAGVICSPAVMANISSTAITREGKAFWETKVLPITTQDNLKYRIATTILINLFGSVLLAIGCSLILPLTLKTVALGALVCITLTFFLATIDIVVNLYRPLLNWTHPTAAVKNNMNVVISLGIRVILGFVIYRIYRFIPEIKGEIFLIALSGLFAILYFISRFLVYEVYSKKFDEISA